MPISAPGVMSQIIREGMDHYWRVVQSDTDKGLTPSEIEMKREYRDSLTRMEKKFGAEWDRQFKKGK